MDTNKRSGGHQSGRNRWLASAASVAVFGTLGYLAGRYLTAHDSPSGYPQASQSDPAASTSLAPSPAMAAQSTAERATVAKTKVRAALPILLAPKSTPSGEALPPSGLNPDSDKGTVVKLDASKLRDWRGIREGAHILLPGTSGESVEGTVNLVQEDGAWLRMGGELAGGRGSFSLNTNFEEASGMILIPESGVGFKISMDSGELLMVERRLSSLVCFPALREGNQMMAAADSLPRQSVAAAQVPPVINTRPGAKGVIYVDFDGESVTDPVWNGGRTINAAPSTLTTDQITQAMSIAAQDWSPFDVTFTTDASLYAAAAPGLRMHVVVTPTDTAARGSGGVAYVDSWSGASKGFRSDVVCWVFNQSVKSVAEAISHEVGHTVGLNHDGQTGGVEYYSGHGGTTSTVTSWGPIMGSAPSRNLTQWSKGEYVRANNLEDDLAIIAKSANKFGLYQTTLANGLKSLPMTGSAFRAEGLLRSASSVDSYRFTSTGGQLTATVAPANPDSDVDVQLELQSSTGATLVLSDLKDALTATISKTLTAGTYTLLVRPAGTGAAPAGGFTTGYSSYASVGSYILSGSVQGGLSLPSFTGPSTVQGSVNTPLSFTVGVSSGSTVSVKNSVLPKGLSFNPVTLVLSGTPTQETGAGTPGTSAGPGLLELVATNSSGSATFALQITISSPALSLAGAFLGKSVSTSPAAPWTGLNATKADGTSGTVAQSGVIGNGGMTSVAFDMQTQAGSRESFRDAFSSGSVLTFYWKASTEALGNALRSGDFVQCRVDGVLRRDSTAGTPLILSGETGWVKQTVRLEGGRSSRVEFLYAKDGSLSAGQDRVWVYLESIGQPPVVTKSPSSLLLPQGTSSFTLSAEVTGATSIKWKKDFATLTDGNSGTGSVIDGASTANLSVTHINGADAGYYWLEATNSVGAVICRPVEVSISAPPVFTQQPFAPSGVKVGDSMTLTATVSGGTPIYYQWVKDGVASRWSVAMTSNISLTVPKATVATAGKYSLTVLNRFGTRTSDSCTVSIGTLGAAAAKTSSR